MFRGKMWLIGQLSVPSDRSVSIHNHGCRTAKMLLAGWLIDRLLVRIDFYGVIVGAMTHNGSEIRPLHCWRPIKGQRSIKRMVFCPSF